MQKQEVIHWLIDKLNKSRKSLNISIRNSKEIQKLLIKYTSFLPVDSKLTRRAWHLINDINTIPKCKECQNITSYSHRTENWGYLTYCSIQCQGKSKTVRTNYKNTCLEKYGVDNCRKSKEVRETIKNTFLKKYGVTHNWNIKESRQKAQQTIFQKYGVKHPMMDPNFKEKWINTMIEKGHFKDPLTKTDFEKYCSKVNEISKKQLYYNGVEKFGNEYWKKRGKLKYHIDHKYSVFEGFKNNIPTYIIGNIENLDLILYSENCKKGKKSSISLEELCNKIFKQNG